MANRRRPSLKKLYADLKNAPPNISTLEVTAEGFKVGFRALPASPASQTATTTQPIKYIAGTPFPDDGSPLNPADLVLFPPDLEQDN